MRGLIVGAIALSIGCRENLPIDLGGIDFDYGFIATFSEEGPPVRVSGIFGVADGRITFGEQPALLLAESEQRFVFVALTADQLPPSFERSRASELDALLEKPPEGLRVEGVGVIDLSARTRLPRNAQLLTAALEAGGELRPVEEAEFDLFDRITLKIPVDAEHCRIDGQTPLAPFGSTAQPLPFPAPIVSAHYLDHERVLVASRQYLYLLDRGATFTSTLSGSIWWTGQDPERNLGDAMLNLAVGPVEADGSRSIVAVGGDEIHPTPFFGRIWLLRLSAAGAFTLEGSETIPGPLFLAATFTPDGTAWIGGPDGLLMTLAPGAAEFIRRPHFFNFRSDIPDGVAGLMPISTSKHDMMAGLKNHLYLRDRDGTWSNQYLMRRGLFEFESYRFAGLTAVEDENGLDYWAVGDRGHVARKHDDGEWELLAAVERDLTYPPRFLPCASTAELGKPLVFAGRITSILGFEDYVHMGHENCNALVAVRRSDQCVSLLAPPGEEVGFGERYVVTIDRWERSLLVGTTGGALYETVLP